MLKLEKLVPFALATAILMLVPAMTAGDKRDLDPKRLANLAESAESAKDFLNVSEMYERRAQMLEEKAERHVRLEQRYAAAPKSLLAKRGRGWNTPERQRQLAQSAREDAAAAWELARNYTARADSLATNVD